MELIGENENGMILERIKMYFQDLRILCHLQNINQKLLSQKLKIITTMKVMVIIKIKHRI